jgi:enoyl-CoA hydratase/carnithine racemase
MDVACVILTGAGAAFCSGGNVKEMHERKTAPFAGSPAEMRRSYRRGIQMMTMYELEVPAIAAVNGPAMGAGLDLAAKCDIRIAAEDASFAESFLRVGLISGDGGAWFLPRVVGMPRALEMT